MINQIFKKTVSFALAVLLVLTLFSSALPVLAAEGNEDTELEITPYGLSGEETEEELEEEKEGEELSGFGQTFGNTEDLLALYPLINDVNDTSGNGYDGQVHGSSSFSDGLKLENNGDYASIPGEIFENQEELTISAWIKSNTAAGNTAALFFGTPSNSANLPESYWLFNPTSPSGYFKSVFTNSLSPYSPWTTEVGIGSVSTTANRNVWVYYTTVISATSISGYINGNSVGTASKSRSVSDFGTNLEGLIGKSNYADDATFKGSFKELSVYATSMTSQEVKELYKSSDVGSDILLQEAKEALSIGSTSNVVADLSLPTTGIHDTDITWQSSDESVISNDGIVTLDESEHTVTLTATLELAGKTDTKVFTVTLPKLSEIAGVLLDTLFIPYVLTKDDTLPAMVQDKTITWTSSDTSVITDEGVIIAPSSGMAAVEITATIQLDASQTATRIFKTNVIEENYKYALSYTRGDSSAISGSMHLALKGNIVYEELNYNRGILFPKASYSEGPIYGTTKDIEHPYVFRMKDNTFGVVAVRVNTDNSQSVEEEESIIFFTSDDLISYEEVGLIEVHAGQTVIDPVCEYDASSDEYRLWWEVSDGTTYTATTDFATVSVPEVGVKPEPRAVDENIQDAVPVVIIPLLQSEVKALTDKYNPVINDDVTVQDNYQFTTGTVLTSDDLGKATAHYSDGSTAEKPVIWNLSTVDINEPGSYSVTGKIKQTDYPFPMITAKADPNVIKFDDKYYFIATDENGQNRIHIREANSIYGLQFAQEHLIVSTTGDMQACLWAPELHEINGDLYILFAASPSNWTGVSCRVKKLQTGGDPTNAADWEAAKSVVRQDGSPLFTEGITLDMTTFEHQGIYYTSWSQRVIGSVNGSADLYMATLNPNDPSKLASEPVLLSQPEYSWERNTTEVVEGPFVLKRDGKIYMTYSGSNVNESYSIGLLTADENADLLDPESWVKTNFPILSSINIPGQNGPGHNSYALDEDGNTVNIFHALNNTGWGSRDTGARRVHWAADGTPVLDMTLDREVLPELRTVTATVEISGSAVVPTEKDPFIWYEFNDTGNTVTDSSGNNNNAAIKGSGASMSEGVLSLPGGASGSGAGYVELPAGIFDGEDTLTISMWLENKTGSADYAAMYIGQELQSGRSYPSQYWLFNPSNKNSQFKSVITNYLNTSAPYNTEHGFGATIVSQGMAGAKTTADWAHYVTVLKPDSITTYYNGKLVGTVPLDRKVSDFGANLVSYIGTSPYPDRFFSGSIKNLKIYDEALTAFEVQDEYYTEAGEGSIEESLQQDLDVIVIPEKTIANIYLPVLGGNGSKIAWTTSDATFITNKGIVTRPVSGQPEVLVTLTANLTLSGKTASKQYVVTVLPDDASGDLEMLKQNLELGIKYITDDIILPTTAGGTSTVTWVSNPNIIANDGTVTRPSVGSGDTAVTLTATIALNGAQATKEFTATVAEESYGELLTYITAGGTERTASLHIASRAGSGSFEPLNNGKAIRYPLLSSKKMSAPSVMRGPDGEFVLISADNNDSDKVLIFDSSNLTDFSNERLLSLNSNSIKVKDAYGAYDNSVMAYRIYWTGGNGKYYETVTDLESIISVSETTNKNHSFVTESIPSGAVDASAISLTRAEYKKVTDKYQRIYSTDVDQLSDITIAKNETPDMPEKVQVNYNDGSSKYLPVEWNSAELQAVGGSGAGNYTVSGTVKRTVYSDPFIEQRADPYVVKGSDGYYYFTGSYPMVYEWDAEGYDRVVIRRSETIEGLETAEELTIWDEAGSTNSFRYVWAPELHEINGTWYIFCTTSRGGGGFDIRPIVIACSKGDKDPYKPENWDTQGRYSQGYGGDPMAFNHFSLDMTYFESGGKHYVSWAEKPGYSDIRLATINPDRPWELTSTSILLSTPEFAWEWKGGTWVNEGSAVIKHDGKVFIAFSGASVDEAYCVGVLTAQEGTDLLDPDNWEKSPYPLLSTDDLVDQNGPGHNSFTVDELGNPLMVYHARTPNEHLGPGDGGLFDPGRHARVKPVHFKTNGDIVLNMTVDEELDPSLQNISITVTVTEGTAPTIPVSSVTIDNMGPITLLVGDSITLTNTIAPANASNKSVAWSSSDSAVASTNNTGAVSAVSEGTAVITVTTADGGKTDQITINVTSQPILPTDIFLTSNQIELTVNAQQMLTTVISPSNATQRTLVWESSNLAVADVDSNGMVTAKSGGKAVIKVTTVNGLSATCEVTVLDDSIETFNLIITSGTGGKIVQGSSQMYKEGKLIAISAQADSGYQFSHWTSSGGGSFANDKQASTIFTMPAENITITAHFTVKSDGGTNSGSTGGSSGGGSSSGGSKGGGADTSPSTSTSTSGQKNDTSKQAEAAAQTAIETAKASGESTATVRLKNPGIITKESFARMSSKGMPVMIHADNMSKDGKQVDIRIKVDPAKVGTDLNLSASIDNKDAKASKALFEKWFKNRIMAVSFDQKNFSSPVEIAVKLDEKLNGKPLEFYNYDKETNSYKRIENSNYRTDKNGYVHFTIPAGGSVIIADGLLAKK